MSLAEFEVIKQFFTRPANNAATRLSVGDDCALLAIPQGFELALTTDTMVEQVHFFADVNPEHLGHKLLAVNLSDLASMGAEPIAITLALSIPKVDADWLQAFARGLFGLAERYTIDLIGGDTTSGPLTLTIQAMGLVPQKQALKRAGAQLGDLIYMTGTLGDAGLGLKIKQGFDGIDDPSQPLRRFHTPEPRNTEGLQLRQVASACIDISDGLASDLGHILAHSQVGAVLDYAQLPFSNALQQYLSLTDDWQLPLIAGDDYELCFTVSPENRHRIPANCTCIGQIEAQAGLRLQRHHQTSAFTTQGFVHFSENTYVS